MNIYLSQRTTVRILKLAILVITLANLVVGFLSLTRLELDPFLLAVIFDPAGKDTLAALLTALLFIAAGIVAIILSLWHRQNRGFLAFGWFGIAGVCLFLALQESTQLFDRIFFAMSDPFLLGWPSLCAAGLVLLGLIALGLLMRHEMAAGITIGFGFLLYLFAGTAMEAISGNLLARLGWTYVSMASFVLSAFLGMVAALTILNGLLKMLGVSVPGVSVSFGSQGEGR